MRRRDRLRVLRILFPRKKCWQPTQRWRAAMLENLSRAPRRRSAEETWRIKEAVRDWLAASPEQHPTQQDLARSLGVSKQYINRLVRRLPPRDDSFSEPAAPGVIPSHVAAREALLRHPVSPTAQLTKTRQPQQKPCWAFYSAVHPAQIDETALTWAGAKKE